MLRVNVNPGVNCADYFFYVLRLKDVDSFVRTDR